MIPKKSRPRSDRVIPLLSTESNARHLIPFEKSTRDNTRNTVPYITAAPCSPPHCTLPFPPHLLPDRLRRLGNNLDELAICLAKLLIALSGLLSHPVLANHYHASRSLCRARFTQLRTALDVDVRHVVVFAENGNVCNHVHGRDISGDDDNGRGVREGGASACSGGFAQRFYDFLDTAAESLGLGG